MIERKRNVETETQATGKCFLLFSSVLKCSQMAKYIFKWTSVRDNVEKNNFSISFSKTWVFGQSECAQGLPVL